MIAETGATGCRLLDKANHLRCASWLTRADVRSRVVEASRPAEGGEWFETFRWTLRKAD